MTLQPISEPGPALGGPSPITWLLGSLAKNPGHSHLGDRRRLPPRALAGWWADKGCPTSAEYLLLPFPAGQRQLLPVSGAPTQPLSVEPLPSLGLVRGREACKLGLGQAAQVKTPTLPPIPPPRFLICDTETHACFVGQRMQEALWAWHMAGAKTVWASLFSAQPQLHSPSWPLHPPPLQSPSPTCHSSEGPVATHT